MSTKQSIKKLGITVKGLHYFIIMMFAVIVLAGCGENEDTPVSDTEISNETENVTDEPITEENEEQDIEQTLESLAIEGLSLNFFNEESHAVNFELDSEMAQDIAEWIGNNDRKDDWDELISTYIELSQTIDNKLGESWRLNIINLNLGAHATMVVINDGEVTQDVWSNFEPSSIWNIDFFVDDFGQPTDEAFIHNVGQLSGTYSNSATTDSDASLLIIIDSINGVAFQLTTGSRLFQNTSSRSDQDFEIAMRTESGDTVLTGYIPPSGDRLYFDESDPVLNALASYDEVMFHIVDIDRPLTTFLFTVETGDFAEVIADFDF